MWFLRPFAIWQALGFVLRPVCRRPQGGLAGTRSPGAASPSPEQHWERGGPDLDPGVDTSSPCALGKSLGLCKPRSPPLTFIPPPAPRAAGLTEADSMAYAEGFASKQPLMAMQERC